MFQNFNSVPRKFVSAEEKKAGRMRPTSVAKCPVRFQLTEDQQTALDKMCWFVANQGQEFLLTGAAGTGKTTVMAKFVRKCQEEGKRVALTAPTNKATRVLRDIAGAQGLSVDCLTIFRMLHLKVNSDQQEKYTAKKRTNQGCSMGDYDVVVVDECSMVGNAPGYREPGLYNQIIAGSRSYRTKLVFVGDPFQLPPVKEGKSPTFSTENAFHLTKVVRQAQDNPIIAMATWLRSVMNGDAVYACPEPKVVNGIGIEVVQSWDDYREMVINAFTEQPDHPTMYRALSWRNKLVDALNNQIRDRIYHGAPLYAEGERYVALQPGFSCDGESIVINTDEDATILTATEEKDPQYPKYRALKLVMESYIGEVFDLRVVHPDDKDQWQRDCALLAKECRAKRSSWRTFWEMHDHFAAIKPHYVTTTHRSQGSTFDTVFVNSEDILKNPNEWEAWRCLYVACTRASRKLVVYDPT